MRGCGISAPMPSQDFVIERSSTSGTRCISDAVTTAYLPVLTNVNCLFWNGDYAELRTLVKGDQISKCLAQSAVCWLSHSHLIPLGAVTVL